MKELQLSATKIAKMASPDFCKFCFKVYLEIDQKPPFDAFPGIFSSIDRYTKKLMHAHLDKHNCVPKCLKELGDANGYMEVGRLRWFDKASNVLVTGEPDDVLTLASGGYGLYDYKTARFPKDLTKEAESSKLLPGYTVQLNVYDFLLEQNDIGACETAALIYFDPLTEISFPELLSKWDEDGFSMGFQAKILPLKLNHPEILPPLLTMAWDIYQSTEFPEGRPGCRNCQRIKNFLALTRNQNLNLKDGRVQQFLRIAMSLPPEHQESIDGSPASVLDTVLIGKDSELFLSSQD